MGKGNKEGEKQCVGQKQCVGEKPHIASRVHPTGDLACNLGMCPNWELNWQPFGSQAGAQSSEPHQPGLAIYFVFVSLTLYFLLLSLYSFGLRFFILVLSSIFITFGLLASSLYVCLINLEFIL